MRQRLALLPAPMARMNLNRVHPLLLEWAGNYAHLREVTAADVIAATAPLRGSLRRQTLTALRSLFGHCKKTVARQ